MPTYSVVNELCPLCKGEQTMRIIVGVETNAGPAEVNAVAKCEACCGRGTVLVQYWRPGLRAMAVFAAAVFALLSWSLVILLIVYRKEGG